MPSQRFEMDTDVEAIDVYRMLRVSNPSPYMYLLHVPNDEGGIAFSIAGSSPEALVTVQDGWATTHPIAGTRWRGETDEEDQLLGKELLADEKERAEHLMLVDLGRNDLGRVCVPGSVRVEDYSHIERYSHVMHLVSTVTGMLAADRTALDAVTACFPAGTLSGAPKVRAMEMIEELEPTRRGLYGGVARLPRLRRQRRLRDRDPHRPDARRDRVRAGRRRGGGRFQPDPTRTPRRPTRRVRCSARSPPRRRCAPRRPTGMADSQPGRLTIRIAQTPLVGRRRRVVGGIPAELGRTRTFDGLSPPKLVTLSGARWSSGCCRSALLLWPPPSPRWPCAAGYCAFLRCWSRWRASRPVIWRVSTLEIPDVAVRAADLVHVPLVDWSVAGGITPAR